MVPSNASFIFRLSPQDLAPYWPCGFLGCFSVFGPVPQLIWMMEHIKQKKDGFVKTKITGLDNLYSLVIPAKAGIYRNFTAKLQKPQRIKRY
jgi:hypothetical protein